MLFFDSHVDGRKPDPSGVLFRLVSPYSLRM